MSFEIGEEEKVSENYKAGWEENIRKLILEEEKCCREQIRERKEQGREKEWFSGETVPCVPEHGTRRCLQLPGRPWGAASPTKGD